MSESKQSESSLGGYIVVALITAAVVYSCTKSEQPSEATSAVVAAPAMPVVAETTQPPASVMQAPPLPAVPPPPTHNYDAAEGTTYYYGAAVTEEQRKTGKQAPDMVAFRYLGRDDKGHDILQRAGNDGDRSTVTCARPCRVIHYADGSTVGYDEGSIIGAAFSDAQRGRLKKHTPPAISPAAVQWDANQPQTGGQAQ